MIILPSAAKKTMLDALKVDNTTDGDGPLFGATVMLFSNDAVIGPATVKADLTEADFTGYARSTAITWGETFVDSSDDAVSVGDTKQFHCDDGVTPNTIYGYAVIDAGDTNLLYAEKFANSVGVNGADDAVIVTPRFVLGDQ